MRKIYLACPYSHPEKEVREWRVKQADKKAAELMEAGNLVFSPLSHSHPISNHCKVDPTDHDFWLRQDLWILDICDEFHILCLPGWDVSKGIDIEYTRSIDNNMPSIRHFFCNGLPVVAEF